jgi:hypothetical protein
VNIELSFTVRDIQAESYDAAKTEAYNQLRGSLRRRLILDGLGIKNYDDFNKMARAAKEADGTYTVTIP